MRLVELIQPCGPVVDPKAAERTHEILARAATADGWIATLEGAWPSLAPVFAAAPYLAGLARRRPASLHAALEGDPAKVVETIIAEATAAGDLELEPARERLRQLKADVHLTTALADLGGVWDLDAVTGTLTRFADACLQSALKLAARAEVERGTLTAIGEGAGGPVPGLFCIAMGKYGAFELNYSSDIDFSIFYEPEALLLAEGAEMETVTVRIAKATAQILQDRTPDGYVFRIDLRLRPDPSSTPPAMTVDAAMDYYESVGQNWERAAHIKARAAAGDIARGEAYIKGLQPFIWRRNLDFAAIADIHSIKRQIHAYKVDERLTAKGANLKLGRGGIREIEFFVQTQQLILGGRRPNLRGRRTLSALESLTHEGRVDRETCIALTRAYRDLRALEHRVQMIADEQTHKLPESDAERKKVAALWGQANLRSFDAAVGRILKDVNVRYGKLFAGEEELSSRFGSLVFTGVEDDPATLETLKRMGFSNPERVSQTIRGWHHGHVAATRTERGRELLTRLGPRLLDAAHATGAPDAAFNRFGDFFAGLTSGVQIQSLFLAQPKLFELIVQVMAFAPRLAQTLARRPAALDALLDPSFFGAIEIDAAPKLNLEDFEGSMDRVRRFHREQAFRVGFRVMSGSVSASDSGHAFADLAHAVIRGLAPAAMAETIRQGGAFPDGEVAVVALGKCGSGEMTARSDLDLMTLYRSADPAAMSEGKGWGAETFFGRFTQRLIAALSVPTGEGELYEVDMRLRPTGSKGPVAVSLASFERYYAEEAEVWEMMSMTRGRVVWASNETMAADAQAAVEGALRQPRERKATVKAVREMRDLLAAEKPQKGDWDLKMGPGGFVDIEFAAQFLQLVHAPHGGPLNQNIADSLAAMREAGLADPEALTTLEEAWDLQQAVQQVLKVALDDYADPALEPKPFQALLARAGGAKDLKGLKAKIAKSQTAAHAAMKAVVG